MSDVNSTQLPFPALDEAKALRHLFLIHEAKHETKACIAYVHLKTNPLRQYQRLGALCALVHDSKIYIVAP